MLHIGTKILHCDALKRLVRNLLLVWLTASQNKIMSSSDSTAVPEPGDAARCCGAPTLLAAAATSFFFCLLFVLFFLCLRFVLLRRHWRRNARVVLHQEEHHHQQQRPKLGLDAAAIAALPSFPYQQSAEAEAECAVCLYVLEEGQMVREIPGCKHVFHQECIDVWLASRASCPVCRAKAEPGRAEDEMTEPSSTSSVVVAVEVSDDEIVASSSSSTPGETETERALSTRSEAGSGLV